MNPTVKSPKSPKQSPVAPTTPPPAPPNADAPKPELKVNLTDEDGNPLYGGLLELVKTNLAQLWAYGKIAVKLDASLTKAQASFNGCKKFQGKVMAAMQVAYTSARNARNITQDTTFEKWYEANVGSMPNPRLQSLGRLFNRLVEMGHMEEAVYDAQPVDALEAANATISAINEKYKGTGTEAASTDEFKKVVTLLNSPGDAAKSIKAVKDAVNGKKAKATETGDEPFVVRVGVTAEIALQLIEKIFAAGQQNVCLVHMADLFKALNAEAQKTMIISLDDLSARIWQHLGPEKAVAMRKEGNVNRAPIGITRAGIPDAQPGTPQLQAA